jgi:hypothetical protein
MIQEPRAERTGAVDAIELYLDGELVEVWEDPHQPFGWSPEDLSGYIERSDWVALFNAVMLTTPWELPDAGS